MKLFISCIFSDLSLSAKSRRGSRDFFSSHLISFILFLSSVDLSLVMQVEYENERAWFWLKFSFSTRSCNGDRESEKGRAVVGENMAHVDVYKVFMWMDTQLLPRY